MFALHFSDVSQIRCVIVLKIMQKHTVFQFCLQNIFLKNIAEIKILHLLKYMLKLDKLFSFYEITFRLKIR